MSVATAPQVGNWHLIGKDHTQLTQVWEISPISLKLSLETRYHSHGSQQSSKYIQLTNNYIWRLKVKWYKSIIQILFFFHPCLYFSIQRMKSLNLFPKKTWQIPKINPLRWQMRDPHLNQLSIIDTKCLTKNDPPFSRVFKPGK